MYVRTIRNKRHTNFVEDLVTRACAADHVINSSRPAGLLPPFFPPPHLIITRNAHGAEEAEGLGTRLIICTYAYIYMIEYQ